jgi:aspartate racemase
MKTIGMIGGTGWVSTLEYYRLLNEEINKRLGGLNAAKILLYSFNYADIDRLNKTEDHEGIYERVLEAALKLMSGGVDGIMICANTLHQYAEKLEQKTGLPVIHIADATAAEIKKFNLSEAGLLGTRWTMEMDFYKKRLKAAGVNSIVPDKSDREFIHSAIMNELIKEIFKPETKEKFINIIKELQQKGAEGIVLGCTEIPLLIKQQDVSLPLFNTLQIHSKAAVDFALS